MATKAGSKRSKRITSVPANIPCHGAPVQLSIRDKQDKKCPRCGAWWRADVTLLTETPEQTTHKVEWSLISCPTQREQLIHQ